MVLPAPLSTPLLVVVNAFVGAGVVAVRPPVLPPSPPAAAAAVTAVLPAPGALKLDVFVVFVVDGLAVPDVCCFLGVFWCVFWCVCVPLRARGSLKTRNPLLCVGVVYVCWWGGGGTITYVQEQSIMHNNNNPIHKQKVTQTPTPQQKHPSTETPPYVSVPIMSRGVAEENPRRVGLTPRDVIF